MEADNIQKVNTPLKRKDFIPFYGLINYCKRSGVDCDDVSNGTIMKYLALVGYNLVIFGALAAETAKGLVKLLQ